MSILVNYAIPIALLVALLGLLAFQATRRARGAPPPRMTERQQQGTTIAAAVLAALLLAVQTTGRHPPQLQTLGMVAWWVSLVVLAVALWRLVTWKRLT